MHALVKFRIRMMFAMLGFSWIAMPLASAFASGLETAKQNDHPLAILIGMASNTFHRQGTS